MSGLNWLCEDERVREDGQTWGEDCIPIYLPQWHYGNQVIPSVFPEIQHSASLAIVLRGEGLFQLISLPA